MVDGVKFHSLTHTAFVESSLKSAVWCCHKEEFSIDQYLAHILKFLLYFRANFLTVLLYRDSVTRIHEAVMHKTTSIPSNSHITFFLKFSFAVQS